MLCFPRPVVGAQPHTTLFCRSCGTEQRQNSRVAWFGSAAEQSRAEHSGSRLRRPARHGHGPTSLLLVLLPSPPASLCLHPSASLLLVPAPPCCRGCGHPPSWPGGDRGARAEQGWWLLGADSAASSSGFSFLLIRGLFVSWKVLIAATAASAIGQLSKPFTSGKDRPDLDLRTVFWSGGMPSTHSAVSKMIIHSLTVCYLLWCAMDNHLCSTFPVICPC
jgi:hypothetical protein